MNETKYYVGIDLGSSNSCVAVWQNNKTVIVPNEEGELTTPSVVAFTDNAILVGLPAKAQQSQNPTNTIYNVKRIIGRKFNDPVVQEFIKTVPYRIENEKNNPVIKVVYKEEEQTFRPEQISGIVLKYMKTITEKFLGCAIEQIVLTVPAYFNDAQRQATKDAATITKLDVIRIINEPTASSLAYGLDKAGKDQNVLIYDYGGLTFDVTVLNISPQNGVFEVKATNGNLVLGGSDIDETLGQYYSELFKKKNGVDISNNNTAMRRLIKKCEDCKKELSNVNQVEMKIENLVDGQDFCVLLTRDKLEELCANHFKKSMEPIDNVLKDSNLNKGQIDQIVLVGGTSRVPKIQKLLSSYFNGKPLNNSVDADHVVAEGACIQAAILLEASSELVDKLLLDVCPLSLGIETNGGIMSTIIKRNTTIPTQKTEIYTTAMDNQPSVDIKIFEGERTKVRDNNRLGNFTLNGIPPASRGEPQIKVTFDLNTDGILHVFAEETSKNKKEEIKITNDKNRLSPSQIDDMIKTAEKFFEDDEKFRKANLAYTVLDNAIVAIQKAFVNIPQSEREELTEYIEETLKWLKLNKEETEELYTIKLEQLKILAKKLYDEQDGEPLIELEE